MALVLATLALKALVPGGYMIAAHGQTLTVEICGSNSAGQLTAQVTIPMKSDAAPGQSGPGKTDGACPYASLSFASLGGAEPLLLAAALAYIVALGFLPLPARIIRAAPRLRPPLRGPPAFA